MSRGSKYPSTGSPPNTISSVPHVEALSTPHLGTLDPEGKAPWEFSCIMHMESERIRTISSDNCLGSWLDCF